MHRARASVPPEAIRIEDEVWQEAFRETTRPRTRARLRSLDGGRTATRQAARAARGRSVARPVGVAPTPAPSSPSQAAPPEPTYGSSIAEEPVRRTVTITGRGAERNLPWTTDGGRRRSARRPHERAGFRPDRVAMWAVFLGMLLLLVAAASSHA